MFLWLGLLTIVVLVLAYQLRLARLEIRKLRVHLDALSDFVRRQSDSDADPEAEKDPAPMEVAEAPPTDDAPAPADNPWESAKDKPAAPMPARAPSPETRAPSPVATLFDRLLAWLKANSFYAIAAISLALAGVFLVQYAISNGFLPPFVRVLLGLAFGGAFILAGEFIRRRFGDDPESHAAYLPSIFSGVGIVTLFASFASARLLYELISPGIAFAGLIAVAILAVILGWLHGALLVAIGLLGGFFAPFIAGGSGDATILFPYFAAITATGLFVDALKRWGWVSALAVILGVIGGWLAWWTSNFPGLLTLYLALIFILATLIPVMNSRPTHKGPMLVEAALGIKVGGARMPSLAVWLAAGTAWALAVLVPVFDTPTAFSVLIVFPVLALLMMAVSVWARDARALSDLMFPFGIAYLLALILPALINGSLYQAYRAAEGGAATATPGYLSGIALVSVAVTVGAAWRSGQDRNYPVIWAAFATLFSPLVLIVMELLWSPSDIQGPWDWALHAIFLAALMTFLAERFWRAEEMEDRHRTALAALSALSLIAFAFFILLSEAALTLALAAMIVIAAALDRRFGLKLLSLYIGAGVVALGYRLILDPGLDWARTAHIAQVIIAFAAAIGAMFAAPVILNHRHRPSAKVLLISGAWAASGVFATILLYRVIAATAGAEAFDSHWGWSLTGSIWLIVAMTQIYRLQIGGPLRSLRLVFAAVAGMLAIGSFAQGLILQSPLLDGSERVLGPVLLNTLLVAYINPAVLLFVATRMKGTAPQVRLAGLIGASILALAYVFLEIRHIWQGDNLAVPGTKPGELYAYTITLLLIGAGLLIVSLLRQNPTLRKAGLVVIGLAVAKVFLIDISGLGGLIRVFSFLALGLSLAGLAWLNRWIDQKIDPGGDADPDMEEAVPDGPEG